VKFLTEYSSRPLHVFGILGILSLIFGFFIGLYLVILKYWRNIILSDRPLLLLSILLIILGLQFISIGLLGEMITFRDRKDESAEKYIEAILDG
jgi:putative Mn2+ efflux pump MntP